ncbi:DUF5054 domain-containing protein [Enterobacter sp. SA187]|uniref:DUF5054 domain-containing protein n=1 Tax=Enterobacter sp. SA187 TaxID=1914861 RepID=UPI000933138A|nr:DUF5054 domain-containing protein [Enterobacter sp. SA187]
MQRVHIIYKTHLDIGFTDLARTVEDKYLHEFIPAVIQLAQKVNRPGTKNFIWTCGAWLITRFLQTADDQGRRALTDAILRGDIVWHGLPFTSHSELLSAGTLQSGLDYAMDLDLRFNKRTIAAKMTDVPGYTQAIIPWLAEAGIAYLHLGVNEASTAPDVPPLFRWRLGEAEIIVNYSPGGYGNEYWCEPLDELLVFCHAADNCAPPDAAQVYATLARYQARYPDAEVSASTLDAFAARVETIKHQLPVIDSEIGDTWNHGLATDPGKVSRYLRLVRLLAEEVSAGRISAASEAYRQAMAQLIMVPEHTWGMDLKLHLADYNHYLPGEFDVARQADRVENGIPEPYRFIEEFAARLPHRRAPGYHNIAVSWQEQRDYIDNALACLPPAITEKFTPLAPVAMEGIIVNRRSRTFGDYHLYIADDGSLSTLSVGGKVFSATPLGRVIYRQVSDDDYQRFARHYLQNLTTTRDWAIADFTKPGLELTAVPVTSRCATLRLHEVRVEETPDEYQLFIEARFVQNEAGMVLRLPEKVRHSWRFGKDRPAIRYQVSIIGKQANRLPEEIWLQFGLIDKSRSQCRKIGQTIDWQQVARNGNRNLHGVERVFTPDWQLQPLDAPLVALHEPRILWFGEPHDEPEGIFAHLYNNIWGTNFPMWYGEDIHAEYLLEMASDKESQ